MVKRSVRSIDPPNGSPRSARSYDYEEYDQEYQTRNSRSPQGGYGAPPPQASYGGGGGGGAAAAPQPLMPYRYGYAVQDDIGNDFNQQEQSDGDQVGSQRCSDSSKDRLCTISFLDHWAVFSCSSRLQGSDCHLQCQAGNWLCGKWAGFNFSYKLDLVSVIGWIWFQLLAGLNFSYRLDLVSVKGGFGFRYKLDLILVIGWSKFKFLAGVYLSYIHDLVSVLDQI